MSTPLDKPRHWLEQVVDYYDVLAPDYDRLRFSTSYGRFINALERPLVARWLSPFVGQPVLDVGCGTGRFLDWASHGIDASRAMVQRATLAHPEKVIATGCATKLPWPDGFFAAAICMHLLMHLPLAVVAAILQELHRVVRPQGVLVLDIPSGLRRRLLRQRRTDWHGSTALSSDQLRALAGPHWTCEGFQGLMFLPIHRFPGPVRRFFLPLDSFLGGGRLKELSSYGIHCLRRAP